MRTIKNLGLEMVEFPLVTANVDVRGLLTGTLVEFMAATLEFAQGVEKKLEIAPVEKVEKIFRSKKKHDQ